MQLVLSLLSSVVIMTGFLVMPASAVSSFCKCTCFTNSTIVRMSDEKYDSASQACLDCTRRFCLDYNLPICKDASEDTDVSTVCFQRDSVKDETVVILFIVFAGGLILYALAKIGYAKWQDRQQRYARL
ncbi:hypothetical protein V1514DRAFT_326622 [Lipomyces japonicus]|uniref:uncharacterized protein n=1 Tax=Lipomyces japonicus TaxID=56871 RepID=UPI0034CDE755